MIRLVEASLILAGMIIGVGMFAIPFSFVSAGFWLGILELLILSLVVTLFHLLYGEIVLSTPSQHRLPGYVKIYLGKWAGRLAWASAIFGISGSLLAYILLGSQFLQNIAVNLWPGSSEIFWMISLVLVGAVMALFPFKKETVINSFLTIVLVGFIFYLVSGLWPDIKALNLVGFKISRAFEPYGVILFALSGGLVIPDLVLFLGRNRVQSRRAIILGSLLPALVYLFFAVAVVGVAGKAVSEEAIRGLKSFMGERAVLWGSLIGFLAVFTSFLATSISFQALLRLDFKLPKFWSWFAVSIIPPLLYFFGFRSFLAIIGAVGAIGIGVDSALIVAASQRARLKEGRKTSWFSYVWKSLICLLIIIGVLYELSKMFL